MTRSFRSSLGGLSCDLRRILQSSTLMTATLAAALPGCGDDGAQDDHGDTDHDHETETESASGESETMPTTGPTTSGPTTDPTTTGETTTTDPTGTGSTTTPDTDSDTDTDTTGTGGDVDVTIDFAVRFGAEDAACGMSYPGVGSADTTVSLADLRFFVSNVRLIDDGDNEVPVTLTEDGEWQYENVALLDFEDASGDCTEGTTAETNAQVVGTVPPGTYDGIVFDVGVPFEHNHLNADATPAPMNTAAMFWNWAAGYKFMRIDLIDDQTNQWNFHLGAQGCMSDGMTDPPEQECTRPARPQIALEAFDPATNTIVLDLEALFDGVDVSTNTENTPPGCQSFMPDENECTDLFPNLGLDWTTGDCDSDCSGQTIFSVQ